MATATDSTTIIAVGGGSTAGFVTGYALSHPAVRNNFPGWVGIRLAVGANPLTVTSLGRICLSGNSGTHLIKLVNAATGADAPGGSVSLSMAGCTPGQFAYNALAANLTLAANTSYYLASQEFSGGDQWYDWGTLSSTNVAAVNGAAYSLDGATWIVASSTANAGYVPPNLTYLSGTQ